MQRFQQPVKAGAKLTKSMELQTFLSDTSTLMMDWLCCLLRS